MNLTACIIFCEKDTEKLQECIKSLLIHNIPIILMQTVPVPDITKVPERVQRIDSKKDNIKAYNYYYQKKSGTSEYDYLSNEFSFSDARNACKSKAETDWVLSIDADERILIEQNEIELFDKLSQSVKCVRVHLVNHIGKSNLANVAEKELHSLVRIFRKELDYYYRSHEQVTTQDMKPEQVVQSSIVLKHIGYSNPESVIIPKYYRNIGLMSYDICRMQISEFNEQNDYLPIMMLRTLAHLIELNEFELGEFKLPDMEMMGQIFSNLKNYSITTNFNIYQLVHNIKINCYGLQSEATNKNLLAELYKNLSIYYLLIHKLK